MIIGIDASRANMAQRTGTEWYAFHIIEELKSIIPTEHTVRLYVKEAALPDMLPLPSNWQVVVLAWPPKFLWTQLRLSFEMYRHHVDVLYVPAHTIPITHPKKTVTVIHDVGFFEDQSLYAPSAVVGKSNALKIILNIFVRVLTAGQYGASERDYHKFSFWLAAREASSIITISDFSKDAIVRIAPKTAKKITRIYNGLHTHSPESSTASEDVLKEYKLEPKKYIMTLGRVEEKKNSVFLVKVFASLVASGYEGKLVFVGKEGFGADRVREEVKKQNCEDRVIFTGYTADESASVLLKNADIFVLPTLYEGFGMPILEAMAVSTPVICSDIAVLKEVGGEGALYANPVSVDSWLLAFEKMKSEREGLTQQGLNRVKLFTWKEAAMKTWKVISL